MMECPTPSNAQDEVIRGVRKDAFDDPLLSEDFGYTYDLIGNRTEMSIDGITFDDYIPTILNQYDTLDENTIFYDDDGNLMTDELFRYIWDAENRLIRVERIDDSRQVDYYYDADSRRVCKVVTEDSVVVKDER